MAYDENCIIKALNRDELESLHTKQLMKMRHSSRTKFYYRECGGCWEFCPFGKKCWEIVYADEELIKSILNTREHVPNKKESKANRINKKVWKV